MHSKLHQNPLKHNLMIERMLEWNLWKKKNMIKCSNGLPDTST